MSHNILELSHHGTCAIRANPDHLHSPTWADDIKNALDEDEHVLAGVMFIHWNDDEMKIIESSIDMDTNAVGEI
jgi:hypothetical protein